MKKIVQAPNPVLSQVAKPVSKVDKNILKIIEDMREAMESAKDPEGVGLAAPQIGVPYRIFLAKPNLKGKIMVFINPEIIDIESPSKSLTKTKKITKKKGPQKLEGCLSLKDVWGTVLRSPKVTLSYLDETGKAYKKEFQGFLAIIIQHETDHLNGVLFPKRVLEQKGKLYKSSKDEEGEDIFEELEI